MHMNKRFMCNASHSGLPKSRLYGYGGDPNNVKLAAAFFHKEEKVADISAIDVSIGQPIEHTSEKLEGSLVRLEYREVPVAHVARERTGLPFFVFNFPTT